jgi:hypothetical protein
MLGGLAGLGSLPLSTDLAPAALASASAGAIRVRDFLTPSQRAAATTSNPLDCTAAFARALASGSQVLVDRGRYALDALKMPNGSRLIGEAGAVLHQANPARPAIACISDAASGQLADLRIEGVTMVGHPAATASLLLLEAKGGYAIWRSRFSYFARDSFRALEVQASEANNVFECEIEVVSEGTRDTAVLVNGGVYNRFRLFLTRTQGWALDDSSACAAVRVVAENCLMFRGQSNQISAFVEGIASPRAADATAITDRGFGNVFLTAHVNMPSVDKGKLRYAFRAFERTVFISPQIIGPGAPPDPFAPTSNFAFTIIGGRSGAANKIEATFDGSDPDHDLRNVTFVGDVRDFTALATGPGTTTLQRFVPRDAEVVRVKALTRVVVIDPSQPLRSLQLGFDEALAPVDGWTLRIGATETIAALTWPVHKRFARLPRQLAAGERIEMVYARDDDLWIAV